MIGFCLGFRNWHIRHLQRCLASIRAASAAPIIVCDLGSRDLTLVQTTVEFSKATLVLHPESEWSRSRALNRAASHAPANVTHFVFTDADMIFPQSWFQNVRAEDRIWLTRSRDLTQRATQNFDESLAPWWSEEELLASSSDHNNDLGQGAAMIIPRQWFEKVGGFDEFYWTWGCEDNDLTSRAEWDGLKVDWLPTAWVAHQWHRRDWPTPEQIEQVKKNREYLYQRLAEQGPIVRNR